MAEVGWGETSLAATDQFLHLPEPPVIVQQVRQLSAGGIAEHVFGGGNGDTEALLVSLDNAADTTQHTRIEPGVVDITETAVRQGSASAQRSNETEGVDLEIGPRQRVKLGIYCRRQTGRV
jgi:hypothetical protein